MADRGVTTVAEALVAALVARRVRHIFGLPGGGSSLDVIEAARKARIDFVLARDETAAVFMASAAAEVSGALGVALVTKGPGTANAVNGAAHASLDRTPVAIITDGFSPQISAYVTHQVFDQRAMFAPVVKAHTTLSGPDIPGEIARVLDAARAPRPGAVHIELTAPAARATIQGHVVRSPAPADAAATGALDPGPAIALLQAARRPVIVVGLEAAEGDVAKAVRRLATLTGAPVLVTYKSKGVVPDDARGYAGIFTGGAAEQSLVASADLIVAIGLDPVELILQPWPYTLPVLEIARGPFAVRYYTPDIGLYGDVAATVRAVAVAARRKAWTVGEIADHRETTRAALTYRVRGKGRGLSPQFVVEQVLWAAGNGRGRRPLPRVTVDAGAHMFSATAFWPCSAPRDLLISNGLATMGFAVPAAIGAALADRRRPVVAFTGDGGLMMCLGELETVARLGLPIIVVVFNDASLSLIDIKQQSLRLPSAGVRWQRPDFAGVMRALGGRGHRASSPAELRKAISSALKGGAAALIDVSIDPGGYPEQLKAMRG